MVCDDRARTTWVAIIVDPTTPVYSFQARRPPTMPRGLLQQLHAATTAWFNPVPLKICQSTARFRAYSWVRKLEMWQFQNFRRNVARVFGHLRFEATNA
jgi:hypothetical protein